jgi:peptidoglycan/xylan/chitin deacetylase (PgdA/CDA1 family)
MANVVLKKVLSSLLLWSGICRIARFFHRDQALILTYHGVLESAGDVYTNRNCVDAKMFDRQMAFMTRYYNVVSLTDLVQWLATGQKMPGYTAAITFDDGFRNNFTVALPILRKYHLPATVFLTTSFIGGKELGLWTEQVDRLLQETPIETVRITVNGREEEHSLRTRADRELASDCIRGYLKTLRPEQRQFEVKRLMQQLKAKSSGSEIETKYSQCSTQADVAAEERYAFLTWQQVQVMAHYQITFGSHTHTHNIMTTLDEEIANFELGESRRLIEEKLGMRCRLFSYPNGTPADFGPREQRLLQWHGYIAAVSQIGGFNDAATNAMALRRINVTRNEDFGFFVAKIGGVWSLLGRLRNRFRSLTARAAESIPC